jgi:hypothetical protein
VLTDLQQQVARLVAALPEADGFALAGGAALVLHQVVDRQTRDLDFFGATADDVDRLVPAVADALSNAGLTASIDRRSHGFARLSITSGTETTELDLGTDARIRPSEMGALGPVLSVEELGADKLLALFGRAQARDFVDVRALVGQFGFDRLCELAREKDPGFSLSVLDEMLGSFGRFSAFDLGLTDEEHGELADEVAAWHQVLRKAL